MQHNFESTDPFQPNTRYLAVVTAGVSQPSTTGQLGERLADATTGELSSHGVRSHVDYINLRELAADLGQAMVNTAQSEPLREALKQVEQADGVIAVSPTFKGSYSGLFKAFFDLVDDDAVTAVPITLAATGGTARHSLMIDHAMRPLFGYLRMRPTVTGVFASTDDWGHVSEASQQHEVALHRRIERAGIELAQLMRQSPARSRTVDDHEQTLEVTPFDQLLG